MKQTVYILISFMLISAGTINAQEVLVVENDANNNRVEALAVTIQNAVFEGSSSDFMTAFDIPSFVKNVEIDEETSSDSYQKGLMKGFINGLENLPKKIIADFENGSYYDYVSHRYDETAGTYYILFRLFSSETGLNYHDYKVFNVDGELLLGDIYIYASGEHISQTFSRLLVNSLPQSKLSQLFGKRNAKDFTTMVEGFLQYRSGNPQKAYKTLEGIKGDLSNEKYFLVIKSQVASEVSDDLYKATLKEMKDKHPDDTTLYLNYIDYYIMEGDYKKAIEQIDILENQTKDDFLAYMKGNLEYEQGNYAKASEHFKYITDNYEGFFEGFSSYLSSLTAEKRFDDAISVLEQLILIGYDKELLVEFVEEDDDFGVNIMQELVDSEAFKAWKD